MLGETNGLPGLIPGEGRQVYSEKVIEHAMNPMNLGKIEYADGFARITGSCGDTMGIWIKVNTNTIVKSSFMTDGCSPSIASGSAVTELVRGKSINEAQKTTPQDVLNALGGLPQESEHCALLAVNTLKAAISDYLQIRRDPWKRAYRKY